MEILGIGLPELAFIVLIALILLGPKDMVKAGQTLGSWLRKFLMSPTWKVMRRTGQELQELPTKLVREAGLEELQNLSKDFKNQIQPPNLRKAFDERVILGDKPAPTPMPPAAEQAPTAPPEPPIEPES